MRKIMLLYAAMYGVTNMQNFEEMRIEHGFQKLSYKVCDTCNVDPLECGSRYGNRRRCGMLMNTLEKLFESEKPVGMADVLEQLSES